MLTAASTPPFPYQHPWNLSFEERIRALCASERRIAYFCERPETSTFRYRIFNMIEALHAAPQLRISAAWFSRADLSQLDRFIDRAHVLVICRTRYDASVNWMIVRARARGLPIFFDIDDLIFDTDYVHLLLHTIGEPLQPQDSWNVWFAAAGRFGATLRLCDGVIVPNQFLAERVLDYAPRIVARVVPNYLNCMQLRKSENIWRAKRESGFARDENLHLGYFSGTRTHNRDFDIVLGALENLLQRDPRIILRIVGCLEPKDRLLKYRERVEFYPLQDFLNLQRLIGEVEINIVPLQNNVFTNCKSELKYFEAAIVGTPTIASPTFAFQNVIRDGRNGFLANAHEWESKIRVAIDTVYDLQRYAALAESAYSHASEVYASARYATQIEAAVFDSADRALAVSGSQR